MPCFDIVFQIGEGHFNKGKDNGLTIIFCKSMDKLNIGSIDKKFKSYNSLLPHLMYMV